MSTVDLADCKAFGSNVNQSMYLHHWIIQALKVVAVHWFWARPNLNETVKLILLWQLLPDFPALPTVRVLPRELTGQFILAARAAGDYPVESEDYERGEKINRNAYIPVELKRVIFVMADRAGCSMSHVINAALRSYLLSGSVPGCSQQFHALGSYRPSLQAVLSMVMTCQSSVSADFPDASGLGSSEDRVCEAASYSPALRQRQQLERVFLQPHAVGCRQRSVEGEEGRAFSEKRIFPKNATLQEGQRQGKNTENQESKKNNENNGEPSHPGKLQKNPTIRSTTP